MNKWFWSPEAKEESGSCAARTGWGIKGEKRECRFPWRRRRRGTSWKRLTVQSFFVLAKNFCGRSQKENSTASIWTKLQSYLIKSLVKRLYLKHALYSFKMQEDKSIDEQLDSFNTNFRPWKYLCNHWSWRSSPVSNEFIAKELCKLRKHVVWKRFFKFSWCTIRPKLQRIKIKMWRKKSNSSRGIECKRKI